MNGKRSVGRPSKKTEARQKLIEQARKLFSVMPYDKVSIRLVAQKAGTNSSLIRYYFGNKAGLFEAMARETLAPVHQQLVRLQSDSTQRNLTELMRIYYQLMVKHPFFPRLVVQVMNMAPSQQQRQLLEKVFTDLTKPMQDVIFEKLEQEGVLRSGVDPSLCKVSYISLMVFPFMAPTSILAIHGIEITEEFLNRLFEHNIRLMTEGFILPQSDRSISGREGSPARQDQSPMRINLPVSASR